MSDQTDIDNGKTEPYDPGAAAFLQQPENEGTNVRQKGKKAVKTLINAPKMAYDKVTSTLSQISQPKGEAILISDVDGQLITLEKLQKVFEKVENRPIAIYSIAGAFRKGKSFMLNLFIMYLESTQKQDLGWMEAKDLGGSGFDWRSGMDANTQGVLIYSKYFMIKNEQGQEVAVFLMDTQGMFDRETSVTKCAAIFTLSTLISSVQIFNLSQQIQENDLQHLQLFTDYGKAVQAKPLSTGKPFQSLCLLVRDWQHTPRFGLEEGKTALNTYLSVKETANDDIKEVRTYIQNTFEAVWCFLLPHPGKKVASKQSNDNKLIVLDMEHQFKTYVNQFVRHLFSPNNLVVKKIGGEVATGRKMVEWISSITKHINCNTLPHIGTIYHNVKEQTAIHVLTQCDNLCSQMISEKQSVVYYRQEELQLVEQEILTEVFADFDSRFMLGNTTFKQKLRQQLKLRMDQHFFSFQTNNSLKLKNVRKECKEKMRSAAEEHENELRKKIVHVELFDLVKFKQYHENLCGKLEENVGKDLFHLDHVYVQGYINKLKQTIQQKFNELYMEYSLQQIQIHDEMNAYLSEALKNFEKLLYQSENLDTDFDGVFRNAQNEILTKFRKKWEKLNSEFVKPFEKRLIKEISEVEKRDFRYESKGKNLHENMKKILSKAQEQYIKTKQEHSKEEYENSEELRKKHKKCCDAANKIAREYLEIATAEEKIAFEKTLSNFYVLQHMVLLSENDIKMKKQELKYDQCVQNCLEEYRDRMSKKWNNLTPTNFGKEHDVIFSEILESFRNETPVNSNFRKEFDNFEKKLERRINDERLHYLRQLSRNKENLEGEISTLISSCLQVYTQYMSKRLQKAVEDAHFEDIHSQASEKSNFQFDVTQVGKNLDLKQSKKVELDKQITEKKDEFASSNLNKRKIANQSAAENIQEALRSYQSCMAKVCNKGYVHSELLVDEHERRRKEAINLFKKKTNECSLYKYSEFEGDLLNALYSEWRIIWGENYAFQQQAALKLRQKLQERLTDFSKHLQEKTQQYLDDEELETFGKETRKNLLIEVQKFDEQNLFPETTRLFEKDLYFEIEHAVKRNHLSKERLKLRAKKIAASTVNMFEQSIQTIHEQDLDEIRFAEVVALENETCLKHFEESTDDVPDAIRHPIRMKLTGTFAKVKVKFDHENKRYKELAHVLIESAKSEATSYMKTELSKVLNEQVSVADAYEKACEIEIVATDKFDTCIKHFNRNLNSQSYKNETSAVLATLKTRFIQNVKEQNKTIKEYLEKAKKDAVSHMKTKIQEMEIEDNSVDTAKQKGQKARKEAKKKWKDHLQNCPWQLALHQYETVVNESLDDLLKEYIDKVKAECNSKMAKSKIAELKKRYRKRATQAVESKYFKSSKHTELQRVNKELSAKFLGELKTVSKDEIHELQLQAALNEEFQQLRMQIDEQCKLM